MMETLTQQPMAQQVTLRGWSALADGWFSLHSDPDVSIVDSHESIHWSWDIDGVTFCSPSLCHWNLCPGGGLIRLYTTTRVMECYHLIKKTTKLNNSLLPGVDVDSSPRCNNMRLPGFKIATLTGGYNLWVVSIFEESADIRQFEESINLFKEVFFINVLCEAISELQGSVTWLNNCTKTIIQSRKLPDWINICEEDTSRLDMRMILSEHGIRYCFLLELFGQRAPLSPCSWEHTLKSQPEYMCTHLAVTARGLERDLCWNVERVRGEVSARQKRNYSLFFLSESGNVQMGHPQFEDIGLPSGNVSFFQAYTQIKSSLSSLAPFSDHPHLVGSLMANSCPPELTTILDSEMDVEALKESVEKSLMVPAARMEWVIEESDFRVRCEEVQDWIVRAGLLFEVSPFLLKNYALKLIDQLYSPLKAIRRGIFDENLTRQVILSTIMLMETLLSMFIKQNTKDMPYALLRAHSCTPKCISEKKRLFLGDTFTEVNGILISKEPIFRRIWLPRHRIPKHVLNRVIDIIAFLGTIDSTSTNDLARKLAEIVVNQLIEDINKALKITGKYIFKSNTNVTAGTIWSAGSYCCTLMEPVRYPATWRVGNTIRMAKQIVPHATLLLKVKNELTKRINMIPTRRVHGGRFHWKSDRWDFIVPGEWDTLIAKSKRIGQCLPRKAVDIMLHASKSVIKENIFGVTDSVATQLTSYGRGIERAIRHFLSHKEPIEGRENIIPSIACLCVYVGERKGAQVSQPREIYRKFNLNRIATVTYFKTIARDSVRD